MLDSLADASGHFGSGFANLRHSAFLRSGQHKRLDDLTDQSVAGAIDMNHVLRNETLDAPLSRAFEDWHEIDAPHLRDARNFAHGRLIGQPPSGLIEQLTLVRPDDQNRLTIVSPAFSDHRVEIVREVIKADARRPSAVMLLAEKY